MIISDYMMDIKWKKLTVVSFSKVQIGNKFSLKHRQKWIIAMIYKQKDSSLIQKGKNPDNFINSSTIYFI